jgi:cell division protein FtsW (lipid II flippase)
MIETQRGVDRARSGAQLALTIVAILLAVGAVVLVKLGVGGNGQARLFLFGALFVVGYVAGHVAIRKLAPGAEPAFFPAAGLLTGLGFAEIYRITPSLAVSQSYWLAIALVAFILTLFFIRDHRQLDGYTYTIGLVAVVLLLLPILPGLGTTINGARVWIAVGPFSFQPAEIGKILLAIFLASYLNKKKELLQMAPRRLGPFHLPQAKDLGPLLLAWGVAMAVLFLENDLGQSLLYFGLFVVMLWVATARPVYLLVGFLLFAVGAVFAYKTVGHVEERVAVWLHATSTKPCLSSGDTIACVYGGGYQLAQGQFAMATGGIGGTGLGQGSPQDIPFASTDFIFAAIAEELGMIGSIGVLLLFGVLVGKGLKVAVDEQDGFGKLLAVGLTGILGIQAFIIVGGVTRVIPLTGVTLPFVSYGGYSLLANYILLALLVRISAGPAPSRRRPLLATPAEGPPVSPSSSDDAPPAEPAAPAGDAPPAAPTQVIR